MLKRIGKYVADNERAIEQIIGREGETATFLSTGLFNSELRGSGFRPRQLKRSVASSGLRRLCYTAK